MLSTKGQLISKPIYDLLTAPKKQTNLICLLFYSSRQTNQIRPFVFLENLRLANLLFKINWPLVPVKKRWRFRKNFVAFLKYMNFKIHQFLKTRLTVVSSVWKKSCRTDFKNQMSLFRDFKISNYSPSPTVLVAKCTPQKPCCGFMQMA